MSTLALIRIDGPPLRVDAEAMNRLMPFGVNLVFHDGKIEVKVVGLPAAKVTRIDVTRAMITVPVDAPLLVRKALQQFRGKLPPFTTLQEPATLIIDLTKAVPKPFVADIRSIAIQRSGLVVTVAGVDVERFLPPTGEKTDGNAAGTPP